MARPVDKEKTEQRRSQILKAALKCFGKKGFHQASMQEICKEAKLSPGTVYHYFKSKDDIIAHMADREVERSQEFADFMETVGSLEEGLALAVDEILGSSEYADGLQVYMEVVCEAGRNRTVGSKLLKAEEIALKAIKKRLKAEKVEVNGVSLNVLSEYIGAQLEMLELYKRYDPPARRCAQMAIVSKKAIRLLLSS